MKVKLNSTILAFAAVLVLLLNSSFVQGDHETCSAYVYPGSDDVDVKLGVILGIHGADEGKCGTSYLAPALQQIVAMNWAANLLNGDNKTGSFIPGVRIGVDVYDDCYTEYLAARHAGALASHIRGISECLVSVQSTQLDVPIAGVIGTSISQTTTIVANIIEPTNIPVVGVSATLPELGDKSKYPGFMRTVPSDLKQAKVIIELAKRFSWSYIVGVQTSDNYGTQGMAEVKRLAEQERICISVVEEFELFSKIPESQMENFVRRTLFDKIDKTKGSIGIVYFGRNPALITLLEYIKAKKVLWLNADDYLKKIYWVASDAIGASKTLAQLIDEYKTKIMVVGPPEMDIASFEDYFFGSFLENPPAWVTGQWRVAIVDIVRNNYGCSKYNFTKESLAGCNVRSGASSSSYMTASLDAVYLLANTIKSIHEDTCGGNSGMCLAFSSALQNGLLKNYKVPDLDYRVIQPAYVPIEFVRSQRCLKNVSGDFEALNQSQYSLHANVVTNSGFKQVGDFRNGTVNIYAGYETILKTSECKAICDECLDIGGIKYLFSPGSTVILGLFSIHWESDNAPFECGVYRQQSASYIAMAAFINSVQQLRRRTGLDFGYLVLDDCYNVLTASRLLNKILSGDLPIVDTETGDRLDPMTVVGAVGAQSSPVTMASLPVLQNLNIPLVSYSSTNPNLDNPISYPFFSRTVSSDAVQAKAITLILKELKVTFVGAIVIQNSYGRELYKLFRSMAEEEEICVDDAFEMTDKTTVQEVDPVLLKYRSKNIKVIVAFAMDSVASTILAAVKQEDTFIFIASEAWGPNSDIISGDRGERARGSLVLGASTSVKLDYGLKEYLQTIEPFSEESSSWLREFWQEQFECDLPGGFNNVHKVFCVEQSRYFSDEELNDLVDFPLTVHSTMATISVGFAVESLKAKGLKMPFNPQTISQAIRSIQLTSASGAKFRPFQDSGNGNGGFQIYNVQHDGKKYVYVAVGTILGNGNLNIDIKKVKFFDVTGNVINTVNSSCLYHRECTVCADDTSPTSKPGSGSTEPGTSGQAAGAGDSSNDSAIIALSVICGLLFLIITVIVVLVVLVCLGKISFGRESKYMDTNSVGYSAGSCTITMSRVSANNYAGSAGSKSSQSDIRPPLPARKQSPISHQVYQNKAFSDIVTSGVDRLEGHDAEPRARSLSLPMESDPALEPVEELRLPDSVAETRPLPKPHVPLHHVPLQNVPSTSGDSSSSGSQRSHHVAQQIPQSKPTQEVQPLPMQPSFHLRDLDNSPNHHNMPTAQTIQLGHSPQTGVLDPYNIYNGYYRNGSLSPQHLSGYPAGPIIFQNVSGSSMVYSTPSSAMITSPIFTEAGGQNNPNFIYIQTAEGIVPVPQQTFVAWQNGSAPLDLSSSTHSVDVNSHPGQNMRTSNKEILMANDPPAHHSYLNTGAPAPCGPGTGSNDYITPLNVIYAGSNQVGDTTDHGILSESHLSQHDTKGIPLHNAQGSPSHAMDSAMSSVAHGDITHTVNSSEYPIRHPAVQMVPHPGTLDNAQYHPQNMSPHNTGTPLQHSSSQNSSPVIIMQQPNQAFNTRPTSLAVVPVHLMNQPQPQQQQILSNSLKGHGASHAGLGHDSQGSSPSAGTTNLAVKAETKIKTPQNPLVQSVMNGHKKPAKQTRTSPESSNLPGDSHIITIVNRPRTHSSPTRLPQPRVPDILEESGSFEVDI